MSRSWLTLDSDVAAKLIEAIQVAHNFDPWAAHNQVKNMYSWHDVAERTEVVYDRLMKEEHPRFIDRFRRFVVERKYHGFATKLSI
jgi:phosphatidylinositol glycan class A protein